MKFYGIFAECCKEDNMNLDTEWYPNFAVCKTCGRLFSIDKEPEGNARFFEQWNNVIRSLKF